MTPAPWNIVARTNPSEGEVAIEFEIGSEELIRSRKTVLDEWRKNLSVPGFRPGHVPDETIVLKVGVNKILEEAASTLLRRALPEVLHKETLAFLGTPRVLIKKLAEGNPLLVEVRVIEKPAVTLPPYKEIAAKVPQPSDEAGNVTPDEIEKALQGFRAETRSGKPNAEKGTPLSEEDARLMGFKDLASAREAVGRHLTKAKTERLRSDRRNTIAEKILAGTKVRIHPALVEEELSHMDSEFEATLARFGTTAEAYFAETKKTRETLRKEWHGEAEKRIKLSLVISEISDGETLQPERETIEKEMERIMAEQKDLDRDTVRAHVSRTLTTEKVLQFLENQ